jgi:hypothetical protein
LTQVLICSGMLAASGFPVLKLPEGPPLPIALGGLGGPSTSPPISLSYSRSLLLFRYIGANQFYTIETQGGHRPQVPCEVMHTPSKGDALLSQFASVCCDSFQVVAVHH